MLIAAVTLNGHRYLSGGMVKILVGSDSIAFEIHRELLCAHSKHFTKLLSKSEGQSNGSLQLPEDDANLFRLISHWIYAKDVDCLRLFTRNNEIRASIRLYVLAEKLQIETPMSSKTPLFAPPTAKDSFLGFIMKDMGLKNATLSCEDVAYIYDNTLASSPLRQFSIRMMGYIISKLKVPIESYRQLFQNNVNFSMDLCKRLLELAASPAESEDPRTLGLFGMLSPRLPITIRATPLPHSLDPYPIRIKATPLLPSSDPSPVMHLQRLHLRLSQR